jgi:hypothetical protein
MFFFRCKNIAVNPNNHNFLSIWFPSPYILQLNKKKYFICSSWEQVKSFVSVLQNEFSQWKYYLVSKYVWEMQHSRPPPLQLLLPRVPMSYCVLDPLILACVVPASGQNGAFHHSLPFFFFSYDSIFSRLPY